MITALIASTLLALADPVTVTVEDLKFDAASAAKIKPTAEIRVNERGQDVVYKGIPLRKVMADARAVDPEGNKMGALRGLSDAVLVVRGSDGYQASVSAAAVAMDEKGTRFLLATERDGKPLGADQGPVKLIIPEDPQHTRWVHNLEQVELVSMPKSAKLKAR